MNNSPFQQVRALSEAEVSHSLLQRVYLWMTGGIATTALVGSVASDIPALVSMLTNGFMPTLILAVLTIGLVFFISARIQSMSASMAAALFLLYAALNGLFFTPIFLIYTDASLASTFLCTAGTFGAMSLYGAFTKRDLGWIGRCAIMCILGLIICTVVNMFFRNNMLDFITSVAGVVIFSGLTAYDTQKLINTKDFSVLSINHVAVLGALTLYLDFINLFLYLLRFMGRRN